MLNRQNKVMMAFICTVGYAQYLFDCYTLGCMSV
jgi:hypothetical protein